MTSWQRAGRAAGRRAEGAQETRASLLYRLLIEMTLIPRSDPVAGIVQAAGELRGTRVRHDDRAVGVKGGSRVASRLRIRAKRSGVPIAFETL